MENNCGSGHWQYTPLSHDPLVHLSNLVLCNWKKEEVGTCVYTLHIYSLHACIPDEINIYYSNSRPMEC